MIFDISRIEYWCSLTGLGIGAKSNNSRGNIKQQERVDQSEQTNKQTRSRQKNKQSFIYIQYLHLRRKEKNVPAGAGGAPPSREMRWCSQARRRSMVELLDSSACFSRSCMGRMEAIHKENASPPAGISPYLSTTCDYYCLL